MYKTRLGEAMDGAKLQLGYVETDPSMRYGRFGEILGRGAMKTVYKAFDEVLGMEVAWNQVKLNDVFRSPEELQRLYSEVHLLRDLSHHAIMRFYASWIDVVRRTFNFITEMFTSGTLREYKQRYKRVDIGAVKKWCRQILEGLAYLHSHDPPVIHRDLKCDNIFVNGHLGQVKIGDLGLAAMLRASQHAHSVIGTPEFMAPELYEEEYDELVDIYSFGMCVLEMLTSEYPYSECSNPAQIYKKVTSGKLPQAFFRIEDIEAREFIGKCLRTASKRPSACDMLTDPFLAPDHDHDQHHQPPPLLQTPDHQSIPLLLEVSPNSSFIGDTDAEISLRGTLNPEGDTIFLKLHISDKNSEARNIYFPFDIVSDTAIDVATEMIKELEITDWEPFEIAEMIEQEISALIPTWKECIINQHNFNYDDDDDEVHHPFNSLSSHSSSHASLPALFPAAHNHDWLQEDLLTSDDATSQSSLNSSSKYSNTCNCSGNKENNIHLSCKSEEQEGEEEKEESDQHSAKRPNRTRYCLEETVNKKNCSKQRSCGSNRGQKMMMRARSLVDLRSQLLHRSLVEEIIKRRWFKSVGAVENIGYNKPGGLSCNMPMGRGLSRIFSARKMDSKVLDFYR